MVKYLSEISLLVSLLFFGCSQKADACTNIIVSCGASTDGSVLVSYAADSHVQYGELYYVPGGVFKKGEKIQISEWDTGGRPLGVISQVARTYSTMGNMNEHQLIITETTFGGREELVDTTGGMDYGSIIYITLQRAASAREAIKTIVELMDTYGYASEGETFSIADKNEAWIMEIIGKGVELDRKGVNKRRGAVWVARRVPDGYICAHANQSRIREVPMDDPENCLYAKDVVSFAVEKGYYDSKSGRPFSFAEAYAPADFGTIRGCDARVWAAFNNLGGGQIGDNPADFYLDYITGVDSTGSLPLFIKPAKKLSVKDVADAMRDHFENTPLDMRNDIGAGGNECPYRWRPMEFEWEGKTYVNERAIATQQTGFWMVGQARAWLPDEIGGILWFGVDDAATSCLTPVYSASTRVPECFRVGNGDMLTYSPTSAFWLFNRLAHQAYLRYNYVAPEIRAASDEHEIGALKIIPTVDEQAKRIMDEEEDVKEYLTNWSELFAARMFNKFKTLEENLFVKYIDGNVKKQNEDGSFKYSQYRGWNYGSRIPENPDQPGYTDVWKRAVASDPAMKSVEDQKAAFKAKQAPAVEETAVEVK